MDTPVRSIFKALSWRVIATAITTVVAWLITGSLEFAALIGGADTVLKLGAYYFHERAWNKLAVGRARKPEYEI